jgi:hypothetical protein
MGLDGIWEGIGHDMVATAGCTSISFLGTAAALVGGE